MLFYILVTALARTMDDQKERDALVARRVAQLRAESCTSVDDTYVFLEQTVAPNATRAEIDRRVRELLQSETREIRLSKEYRLYVGHPKEKCGHPALILRNGAQTILLRVDEVFI